MIGNVVSKIVMGILADKWGIWKASWLILGGVAVGFALLLIGGDSIPIAMLYLAAVLLGLTMAAGTIIPNLMALNVYKAEGYQEKYGIITAAGTLVGAVAFAAIGYIYDFTGSYRLSFWISLVMVAIFFAASILLFRIVKKEQPAE
jgi:MFS family permease